MRKETEGRGKVTPVSNCNCCKWNSYANPAAEAVPHQGCLPLYGQVEQRPKQNWQLRAENFNNSTAQSGKSHSLNDADEILMKYRFMQKPHTLSNADDTHLHSPSYSRVQETSDNNTKYMYILLSFRAEEH